MTTHGELFAGIGGFGLGFDRSGLQTIWHVEIDKNCQNILRRHNPDSLFLSDVCEAGKHNLPYVDVISFGSPCQDLSIAGKRKGLINGTRSNLFFEAIRIVEELKPVIAVWENVPGALSSNSGRDFAQVLGAFRDIGARDIAWRILDAQYFGVAQRRRRIFLIADFGGERAAEVLFESEGMSGDSPKSRKAGEGTTAPITASTPSRRNGGSNPIADSFIVSPTLDANIDRKWGSNQWVDNKFYQIVEQNNMASTPDMISLRSNPAQPVICMSTGQANAEIVKDGEPSLTKLHEAPIVCFNADRDGHDAGEVSPPLTHKGDGEKAHNAYPKIAVWEMQHASEAYRESQGGVAPTLQQRMGTGGNNIPLVGIRRLIPTECERLQGFPDGWTDGQSDSARYRQLGNAVAVPVVEWIGNRIMKLEVR